MRTAIVQVADTSPLESLVVMLRAVGYECFTPSPQLRSALRELKCDTVLDIEGLVENWGYDQPMPLPVAPVSMMDTCDLYVDVKGHRNGPLVWAKWPRLGYETNIKDRRFGKCRTLWYRINGAAPEHVIRSDGFDCGNEVNPPCPVLTPNMWYGRKICECGADATCLVGKGIYGGCATCRSFYFTDTGERAYAAWPPFHRLLDYYRDPSLRRGNYGAPMCLIHNLSGWGYGPLIAPMQRLGVKLYGRGSPDGLLQHQESNRLLASSLAMVHLKSSDAPGYALYEALASGVPCVVTRRLIWRSRMQDLFIPGKTCLVFDRETHDPLSSADVEECTAEVASHLNALHDPAYNQQIGLAGRERLIELMWSQDRPEDVASLQAFMARNFG